MDDLDTSRNLKATDPSVKRIMYLLTWRFYTRLCSSVDRPLGNTIDVQDSLDDESSYVRSRSRAPRVPGLEIGKPSVCAAPWLP
jgi:hypothetical protein